MLMGRLLNVAMDENMNHQQPNKKWGQLQANTRAWIYATAKKEYTAFVEIYDRPPEGQDKHPLAERVYAKVKARDIPIAFTEMDKYVDRFFNMQNSKHAADIEGI